MIIKNGTTPRIPILMVDATDDETAETGLTVTCQISKNGGAFATVTNAVTEIANGWYYVALTATETNTDGPLIVRATGTGADEWRDYHEVVTSLPVDVVSMAAGTVTAAAIATGAIDADAIADNAIDAGAIAADAITAAKIATGAIDADALAADAVAEIADGVWDEDATGHQTQGTFGQAIGDPVADADTIWGLVNTNLDATVSSRASQTSVNTVDDFLDTEIADIQARLPAALVGGKMDSDATAISGDTTAADNLEKEYDGTGYGHILQRTTIATLASQTSFTLTAGSADNDAYNGCIMVIEDVSTAAQKAVAVIADYTGATKTITLLNDPAVFTMATTDIVTIIADRALKPAVDNRTLGVAADGDLLEVNTLTGHTAQTGDNFARLGAPAGVSVSADILTLDNLVDDLESRLGTPSNLGSGATVAANLVDIEGQTDDIGAAGAGLTAVPWNAAWDAEVQSEVDDALVARFLDKLVLASGTADSGSTTTMVDAARTEADADYWKGRIILFTSGVIVGQCAIITDFNATTDTFTFAPALTQAVATQTYVILPAISVWDDTLAEHLASGTTGNALNAAGSAGDPWATALPGAYGAGTAGKIVGDNVNATISSRASQTSVDTIDDFLDTEVAATLAAVDTEVAAIKAVTDLLPNAGALTNLDAAISTRATPAQVNAEVVDALATDTYAEPGQGAPAATATLAAKVNYLYKAWRNKSTQTSTTYSLYADDTTTVDQKATVSDDATTFTKGEVATGP